MSPINFDFKEVKFEETQLKERERDNQLVI